MRKPNGVGYGKPPKTSQFSKGKSGNPKGRPKGASNLLSDVRDELSERFLVNEGGRSKRITKGRGVVKALFSRAMKGHTPAAAQLMKMAGSLEEDDEEIMKEVLAAEDEAVLRNYEERLLRRLGFSRPKEEENV